jgi:hypothetical protein
MKPPLSSWEIIPSYKVSKGDILQTFYLIDSDAGHTIKLASFLGNSNQRKKNKLKSFCGP